MDPLVRIKRAILAGRYAFSEKARREMEVDGLTELDVAESIVNSVAIYKRLRSRTGPPTGPREYLYVIYGSTLAGVMVYSKGKFARENGDEVYYFLVSSKRAK
jgi:hypothetical protein